MGDIEFDPAGIDRAIERLTDLLDLMDRQESRVTDLQRVAQPGAAPATRAFHGLLTRSMSRLRQRHDAFRQDVERQIEDLRRTRRSYTGTDRTVAHGFTTIAERG